VAAPPIKTQPPVMISRSDDGKCFKWGHRLDLSTLGEPPSLIGPLLVVFPGIQPGRSFFFFFWVCLRRCSSLEFLFCPSQWGVIGPPLSWLSSGIVLTTCPRCRIAFPVFLAPYLARSGAHTPSRCVLFPPLNKSSFFSHTPDEPNDWVCL